MRTTLDAVIACALATEGASEVPANSNAGPYVERVQAGAGLKKGDPWCAAQVYDWGIKGAGALWPLPKTGSCQALYDFAKAKGVVRDVPAFGFVFLIYEPSLGRFGHSGLIVAGTNDTISGNTSGAGSREGWIVGRRLWTFKPEDKFIDWLALVPSLSR